MTIFGTPGGTPLNQTGGFQGTQPGNPVQNTLSPINPGVGMFPPNSNNQSGDTVAAAASRAAMPVNADCTNYGTKDSRPGRTVLEAQGAGAGNGIGINAGNLYGWPNGGAGGGNSLGAGGLNQSDGPTGGETTVLVSASPANQPTIPTPVQYQG